METCVKSQVLPHEPRIPSFLYVKRKIYYFRYAFPQQLQIRFHRTEVRISLKTLDKREATERALFLKRTLILLINETCMLTFDEIKARLNTLLLKLVDSKVKALTPYKLTLWESHSESPTTESFQEFHQIEAKSEGKNEAMVLTTKSMRNMGKLLFTSESAQQMLYLSLLTKEGQRSDATASYPIPSPEQPFRLEWLFSLVADKNQTFLVNEGYFSKDEFEQHKALIGKLLVQMENTVHETVHMDEQGDYTATLKLASLASQQPPSSINNLSKPSLSLAEAINSYIDEKLHDGAWKKTSHDAVKNRLSFLTLILGEVALTSITRDMMRDFRETLKRLPPNIAKAHEFKGKSIGQILDMNPAKTLNIGTINDILEAVATMFEWCVRETLLQTNPATRLQMTDQRAPSSLRDAFSNEELAKIFSHESYTSYKDTSPQYYWIPLIALYSGMRLEEIAQLHCSDLYKTPKGTWVFDLNTRELDEYGFAKSLKNVNAARMVPVHPVLLDEGLLDYHARVVAAGEKRLFWQLSRSEKTVKYGKQPGKRFKATITAAIGPSDKKTFHSLRHTFADFYKQNGLQDDKFRQLYGHALPHLAASQYGSQFPPELLYNDVIARLNYGQILQHATESTEHPIAKKTKVKRGK